MMTKITLVATVVAALGLAAWFAKDTPAVRAVLRDTGADKVVPAGGETARSTGEALANAGVHKCLVNGATVYSDKPCPKGARELKADGGTVTVTSFPKAPKPAEPGASGVIGSRIVKGFSQDEIDRMRDAQIEAAANR